MKLLEIAESPSERLVVVQRELKLTRLITVVALALLFFSLYRWNKQGEATEFWFQQCVNQWGPK